jgi:hypothetical protein
MVNIRMPSKRQRQVYRKVGKKSLCRGVKTAKPNKCNKLKRSCSTARGTKRTYCRKKKAARYSKRKVNPNHIF